MKNAPKNLSIDRLLEEAGIAFTVVERCPHPGCAACNPAPARPKAA